MLMAKSKFPLLIWKKVKLGLTPVVFLTFINSINQNVNIFWGTEDEDLNTQMAHLSPQPEIAALAATHHIHFLSL